MVGIAIGTTEWPEDRPVTVLENRPMECIPKNDEDSLVAPPQTPDHLSKGNAVKRFLITCLLGSDTAFLHALLTSVRDEAAAGARRAVENGIPALRDEYMNKHDQAKRLLAVFSQW